MADIDAVEALPRARVGWTIDAEENKPREILPNARSAVVFSVESRDDVHEVEYHVEGETYEYPGYLLLAKIRRDLIGHLKGQGYDAVYPYEDKSFASFKVIARLAGIGAFGKNSLIISPTYGPWLRIGVLYTDALLEPDRPFDKDLCGDCKACIEACPVGAIDDHVVDDRKCLVGLSMEDRQREDLRPVLDIFEPQLTGRARVMCTACQTVCPHTSEERRKRSIVGAVDRLRHMD